MFQVKGIWQSQALCATHNVCLLQMKYKQNSITGRLLATWWL
jgi:hypothetical protein